MPCAAPSRNNLGVLGPCGYKKLLSFGGGVSDPLANSPKGLWRLNEPSGTSAADASGNGNAGVISGGVTLNQPGAPQAPAGASMAFNSGAVTVASAPALNLGDVFTLEAWLATTSLTEQDIFYKSAAYEFEVRILAGTLRLTLVKAGVAYVATAGVTDPFPLDGQFHHVAVTKNGAAIALYQDGVDITPGASVTNQTFADSANPLTIGSRTGGTMPVIGRLDEVAIYSAALTPAQILSRVQGGTDVSAQNLCQFHYQMKYGQSAVRQPMAVEP